MTQSKELWYNFHNNWWTLLQHNIQSVQNTQQGRAYLDIAPTRVIIDAQMNVVLQSSGKSWHKRCPRCYHIGVERFRFLFGSNDATLCLKLSPQPFLFSSLQFPNDNISIWMNSCQRTHIWGDKEQACTSPRHAFSYSDIVGNSENVTF